MLSFYKSANGRIQQIPDYDAGCWINAVAPDEAERAALETRFHIRPEFLKSSLDEEESSHIENEDGDTLIMIDVPYSEKSEDGVAYATMPVGIVITADAIATICLRDNPVLCEMADGFVKNVNPAHRTQFVLHLLLRMAARFLLYLKQIDKRSHLLETELRKSMRNKELVGLMDLEKSLVYFQTSLKSNEVTLEKILRSRYIKLYDEDQDLLEDVLIEIKQAIEMSDIYLSILSGTMDAFASVISNNLNIVMKRLTSITMVMAIPTMIFSFYGMNIGEGADALPFAGTIWIPLVLAVLLTAALGLLLYKKDMF